MLTGMACSLGLERVLWIDQGVRVFAPTRNGRVLSQLRYLPISKTMLIDDVGKMFKATNWLA